MPDELPVRTLSRIRNRRVHMANERTFLAWIRTSIAIMAFGFVIERFALFVGQLSLLSGRETHAAQRSLSTAFGIALVAAGAVMGVLSFVRYKKVERQIDRDAYEPSLTLDVMLALAILAIGIFLVIYLIHAL